MDATTTSPRGARPIPSQRVSGQPPPAPAVCILHRNNAAWHVNGTQQPPSCRPAGGLAGFEPQGSVSDTQPRACVIRCPNKPLSPDTHHEGASSNKFELNEKTHLLQWSCCILTLPNKFLRIRVDKNSCPVDATDCNIKRTNGLADIS